MRKDIGAFLLPLSKWKIDIEASLSDCCGFFSRLNDGESLNDAFASVKDGLVLPEDVKSELESFFSDFGRGYAKEELLKLDSALSSLCAAEQKIKEDVKNDSRSVKALIIAAALGLVILLI